MRRSPQATSDRAERRQQSFAEQAAQREREAAALLASIVPGSGPDPKGNVDPDKTKGWIGRMLPILAAHKATVLTGIITATLALIPQIALPRVMMAGIDQAIIAHRASLAPYVIAMLLLGAFRLGTSYMRQISLQTAGYDIEYDLRTIIYKQLTRLSFGFYDRVQSGQLISRANSDIRAIQMFLTFAPNIAIQVFGAAVAFVVMLTISVPLAFVAMATMPLVYLTGLRLRKLMFPISWVVQARLAEVATLVEENVSGVRVVKSFAAERQQLQAMAKQARRVQWATVRQVDIQARWAPLLQNLPGVGLALVLLYGGELAIHHQVTIGALVAFNSYVILLQAPFRMLGQIVLMAQRAAASAERVYEILDEQPDITDSPTAVDLVDPQGQVSFRDVTFAYGDGPEVLSHFNLELRPGQTVALVGRTGSGKSTIAKLLERFYDVTSGSVEVDGHDVRDLTQASLRAHVGMVLDEPFLFSASIRDNIAYGRPGASLEEVLAAAKAACAHEFVMELSEGYDTVVGERGYTLSGGQRQRIALARTLLVNPRVLILDDATSAIDVQVELEIHNALRRLMASRTTLIIAHRLSTISLADRVALVEGGRVVAQGTHAELLATEPRYVEVLAQVEAEAEAKQEAAEGAPAEERAFAMSGGRGGRRGSAGGFGGFAAGGLD
ncbi:MAG TPA: ABC transporter ATP-binding protein [Chloroflexota bacterium]|nr:ABC transporter ATP-binding protein [Chloroflexota bacterium]